MIQPLSDNEFKYWQELFKSHSWNGDTFDASKIISQAPNLKHLNSIDGAIFHGHADYHYKDIKFNNKIRSYKRFEHYLLAIRDRFIIHGDKTYHAPYSECISFKMEWETEKIPLTIGFTKQRIMTMTINTYKKPDILTRLSGNSHEEGMIAYWSEYYEIMGGFLNRIVN